MLPFQATKTVFQQSECPAGTEQTLENQKKKAREKRRHMVSDVKLGLQQTVTSFKNYYPLLKSNTRAKTDTHAHTCARTHTHTHRVRERERETRARARTHIRTHAHTHSVWTAGKRIPSALLSLHFAQWRCEDGWQIHDPMVGSPGRPVRRAASRRT